MPALPTFAPGMRLVARQNPIHLITRLVERLAGWEARGSFRLSLLFIDAAVAAWLVLAQHVFTGSAAPMTGPWIAFMAIAALSGYLWRLHGLPRSSRSRAGGWTGHAATLGIAQCLWPAASGAWPGLHGILWSVAAQLLLSGLARLIYRRISGTSGPAPLEGLRWTAIGSVSVVFWWIYYMPNPLGSGDAYWYALMLSDYLTQLRAGTFPVWIGQTEFAFNGAVSPLRFAPGFQHAGGLLDLLTGRSLEFVALKNAMLVLASLAGGFSTYFCLRAMLPRRPNIAAGLALLYLLSPGVMAPLFISDQYMSFLALPFVPITFYGIWRAYARNDWPASVLLGAGVGALWLCHTPIAMWTSLLCAGMYAGKLAVHRHSGCEMGRTLLAVAVFVLLGSYPIVSALTLDNVPGDSVPGRNLFISIRNAFPGSFLPIDLHSSANSCFQAGYSVLAAGLVALTLLVWRRRPATVALFSAAGFLLLLVVPVPGLCLWLWQHLPAILLRATNDWPMQRLYLILAALLVFACASTLAAFAPSADRRRWSPGGWIQLLVFLPALWWSGREARILIGYAATSVVKDGDWRYIYQPDNLILTRYPYVSFAWAPSYFSHGYMDPVLENRLLRRSDQTLLLTNAEAAASAPPAGRSTRLVFSGRVHANLVANSFFYLFDVHLHLASRRHYALRVRALEPANTGWLQVKGRRLFREYLVPDSGVGVYRADLPPRSFGSSPTSSPIMSLCTDAPGGTDLSITYILPQRPPSQGFDAADLELWEYEPGLLPIMVHTLTPYRVRVESPEPAYLESPRMWLGGYQGIVNNQRVPVLRSPDNLAMVGVPAGVSEVEIKFKPALLLELSYWVTLAGWSVLAAAAAVWLGRRPESVPAPA